MKEYIYIYTYTNCPFVSHSLARVQTHFHTPWDVGTNERNRYRYAHTYLHK